MGKCRDLVEIGMNGIDGKTEVKWSEELFPMQGASPTILSWNKITPPWECILGEVYLYLNEYEKAKLACLNLIRRYGETEDSYQLNLSTTNGNWKQFGYGYDRQEHVVYMQYDYAYNQTNHYVDYYSNLAPNKYYLKPTEAAMNRFRRQYTAGGILNDRYRGEGATFKQVNGEWVLQKFLGNHSTADKVYRNDVIISLYRAGEIHLFLIEALIGMGRFDQALPLLNDGVGSYYDTSNGKFLPPYDDGTFPSTLYVTGKTGDRSNRGVRGRVDLQALGQFSLASATAMDTLVNIARMDSILVEEYALELSGEAKAFYAMNRIARRWSADAPKFWASQWIDKAVQEGAEPNKLWGVNSNSISSAKVWASKVASKYTNGRQSDVESKLTNDPNAWFIKFDLKYSGQSGINDNNE